MLKKRLLANFQRWSRLRIGIAEKEEICFLTPLRKIEIKPRSAFFSFKYCELRAFASFPHRTCFFPLVYIPAVVANEKMSSTSSSSRQLVVLNSQLLVLAVCPYTSLIQETILPNLASLKCMTHLTDAKKFKDFMFSSFEKKSQIKKLMLAYLSNYY